VSDVQRQLQKEALGCVIPESRSNRKSNYCSFIEMMVDCDETR
jgi:hypothetical protein